MSISATPNFLDNKKASLLQQHQALKEATDVIVSRIQSMDDVVQDILSQVVIETIRKYQQRINVGIQDSVLDLLANFKKKVSDIVFETANNWRLPNKSMDSDGFLFPRGCRFCFCRGSFVVFVIEQDPGLRTLVFDPSLLDDYNDHRSERIRSERLTLSLPFVTFIVVFQNQEFKKLFCSWQQKPIESLKDKLGQPILPNIHSNLEVCTGKVNIHGSSYCAKVEQVISQFWNSKFNQDLAKDYWWTKHRLDLRLETARTWHAESISDPLFILGIPFPTRPERTLKARINEATQTENEPDENYFRHRLSESVDKCSELLFVRIMDYFKNTRFEKFHPTSIKEKLASIMNAVGEEFNDLLLVIQADIETIREDIQIGRQSIIKKKSPLWQD